MVLTNPKRQLQNLIILGWYVATFIISMKKLQDADWLRIVQLFSNCTAVQLMSLPKQTNGGKPLKHEEDCPRGTKKQKD